MNGSRTNSSIKLVVDSDTHYCDFGMKRQASELIVIGSAKVLALVPVEAID